jgi:hypothetical protein
MTDALYGDRKTGSRKTGDEREERKVRPGRQWLSRSRLDWRKDGMEDRYDIDDSKIGILSDCGRRIHPSDETARRDRDGRLYTLLKDSEHRGAAPAHGGVDGPPVI